VNIIFNVLNQLLNYLFQFTGDWGITIILVTLIVRFVLTPMSIKQKHSMNMQQDISKKVEDIKEKYKGNEEKIKEETQKHYTESTKGFLGCLITLLQLPIIYSLYRVIMKIPYAAGTIIVPWVSNIKVPDNYYIIPIIYIAISCIPSLLPYIPYLKTTYKIKVTRANILSTLVISLLIIIKAPIAVGMYFITTSIFSAFEEIGFRLYIKNKSLNYNKQ
jgi:YidC/Oxa1 family membrane protein insertase